MFNLDKVFIIAEVGVNHNGDMEMAFKLIDIAVESGADAVKFQNFKAEYLVKRTLPQETYQKINYRTDESQFEMLKKYELTKEDTINLKKYAEQRGIEFISTPYDKYSTDLLEGLEVDIYKIGSGEITDIPFLEHVARKNKTVILSTGASTMDEVEKAVLVITKVNKDLILLHCTSCYPTKLEDVNLNAMKTLMKTFDYPIGLSDHTTGINVSIAAVAMGAKVIERHFTLDKNLPGPDHKASLEPKQLKDMVKAIREVEIAFGSYEKKPCSAEAETIRMGRRSILTKTKIKKGQIITEDMLITKRPATGITPKKFPEIVGKKAKHDLEEDYILSFDDIEA